MHIGHLIREDNAYSNKTVAYLYDNGGNILSRTEYAYSPAVEDLTTLTSTDTIVYTYGNTDWKDQLTSFDGQAITYDAIGNPLSYRGMTLIWQNGRQLATLSKDGLSASYTYNDAGLRLSKTINGTTTEYYWNGTQLLAQKTGITYLYFLYDETGSAVGYKYNNKTYIYVKNLQGDVTSVIDGTTGTAVATYTYDSWGNVLTATGTMAELNPIRYRGYYYDTDTELYYLQSRYYDAEVGRFINADGYTSTGQGVLGNNMFAYGGNNPVNNVDPSGHFWLAFILVTIVIACVVGSTGCAPMPTSDVGAAQPYVEMSGSNDPNSPNCYAYAIGSTTNEQPGGRSGKSPKKWNDVNDVGKSVQADLKAMGKTVRVIDGPNAKVYDNEFKIALRVGTAPFYYNMQTDERYYDYHFMRQTDTGQWAEKHGTGGDSVLWDYGMTPDTIPWTLGNYEYYDSKIIYYAIGN